MSLFISGFYAALTGLLVLALAYRVVRLRRAYKIGLGDGGNDALHLANRVHGNLLENAPIALLLLVCWPKPTAWPAFGYIYWGRFGWWPDCCMP